MGLTKIEITEHICDGCGNVFLGQQGDVTGTHISWSTIDSGGTGGVFWVCKDACMAKAFKRRYDIESQKEGRL